MNWKGDKSEYRKRVDNIEGLSNISKFGFIYKGDEYSLVECIDKVTCQECALSNMKNHRLKLDDTSTRDICMSVSSDYCNVNGKSQFVFKK